MGRNVLRVEWPRGEATDCKSVYTGSNPVSTSGDRPGQGHTVADRPPRRVFSRRDPRLLCRQRLSSLCPDTRYIARRLGSTRAFRGSRDTPRCGVAPDTSTASPWPRLSSLSMIRASVPLGVCGTRRRYVSALSRMDHDQLGCPGGTADPSNPVSTGDWRSGSALP